MGCTQSSHCLTPRNLQSNLCVHNIGVDILDKYVLDAKLGEGAFGAVYIAINKETDERYALKVLKLQRGDNSNLRKEINVWRGLQHPNIVRLLETYEDSKNIYMVMELCSGGRILEKLQERGCGYTEDFVRMTVRKIASAVCYLHSHKICHRDLKLEHLLFENDEDDAEIKICDFGASTTIQQGENMHTVLGTMFYMAPEVLKGEYHEACDLWSLGVIMYMMLSNKPPFHGQNDDQLVKSVMKAEVSFALPVWSSISNEAKSLIQRLLNRNPSKRYSASQVLRHPWLRQGHCSKALDARAMYRMVEFCSFHKLKQAALLVIAFSLQPSEVVHLRKLFNDSIDTSSNGVLRIEDLQKAMIVHGYSAEDVEAMFHCMDQDESKDIDFLEFVAATVEPEISLDETRLKHAFEFLDKNHSGNIDEAQLRVVMGPSYSSKDIAVMIADVDKENTSHMINFEDFVKMMKEPPTVRKFSCAVDAADIAITQNEGNHVE